MTRSKVLFLCTGNSCRSQMAEGLVNHFLRKGWQAFSAGTRPSGEVHPLAIKAMAELGIDIADQTSKSVDAYRDQTFELVVTVCDSAAEECPVWLGKGEKVHISFPDPALALGSEEERLELFRAVRDDLRRRIFYFLENRKVLSPGYL
jgi:arsenate reductase